MVIDIHAHVGDSDVPGASLLQRGCTPEWLIELDHQAGIDISVIFSTTYTDYHRGNETIARAVEKYPDSFIGFARTDPNHANAVEAFREGVEQLGLKGLKMSLNRAEDYDLPATHEIMMMAMGYDIPVLLCGLEGFGIDKSRYCIELAGKHPETKVIIGHMGGGIAWRAHRNCIEAAKELENVYLDPSSVVTQQTIREAAVQVPDKLLFGSDGPALNPKAELEKIRALFLGPDIEDCVFEHNARDLLKLD